MGANKTIKIFVDAHGFDTSYQGVQSFLRQLYNALLQYYPQLDIYMGAYHADRIQQAFPLLPKRNILSYKTLRPAAWRFVSDIPRLLKQYPFQFAHFQYIAPRQQPGCRYIVTLHDVLFKDYPSAFPWLFRQSRNYLFGNSIKRAAIKTTVSTYAKERIAHHYAITPQQLHIIPNSIGPIPFSFEKEIASAEVKKQYGLDNFILYVSRIEPRKNHIALLQAWLELKLYKQGISLVFIGSNHNQASALFREVQQLPKEAALFFRYIEQVDDEALVLFLQAARLFVYPSLAEGFGIPPLEAAVAGTPVLCSHATAMQDFDFFGKGLFDPWDKTALTTQLLDMLAQPPDTTQLSAIATTIQQRYAPQQSAALFYDLLNQHLTAWH